MKMFLVFLAAICGIFFNVAAAETWETLGPAIYGACYAPSFNPHNQSEIMFGTDMGAAFFSGDQGKTWKILGSQNKGGNPGYRGCWKTCFDPYVKNRLWIVSEHGVFRSDNSGENWKLVTPEGTPQGYYVFSFVPGNSKTVYLGQGFISPKLWHSGRLWRSADSGNTWTEIASPDKTAGAGFTELLVFPGEKKLILCGHRGIWESLDCGKSWKSIRERFPFPDGAKPRFASLLLSKGKTFASVIPFRFKGKVYGGLWESSDDGATWKESAFNKYAENMMKRSYHTSNCGYLLAGAGSRIYLGIHGFGVSRSDDGGLTWKQMLKPGEFWKKENGSFFPSAKADTNIRGGASYGTAALLSLAVNPANPDMVMYTDNSSATMSVDGGATWYDAAFDYVYPFDKGRFGAEVPTQLSWAIRSRGPQMIQCNMMGRAPDKPEIMYAAYWDHGLHVSRDSGKTWERPSRGLDTYNDLRGARSFTVDPAHPGRVYFTSCNPHGRAFVSNDYGVTFRDISVQRQPGKAREENKEIHSGIVIDPENSDHLFMTTDIGLFESDNAGKQWKDITPSAIRKFPQCRWFVINPSGWFLGIAEKRGMDVSGLYFSSDKGKNWKKIMPDDIGGIASIDFCKSNPKIGYLLAFDPEKSGRWSKTTLYKTIDGGITWEGVSGSDFMSFAAVHPEKPNALYMAKYVNDLRSGSPAYLRSDDGGQNWTVISRDIPVVGQVSSILFNMKNAQEIFFSDFYTVYRLAVKSE